jgi:hypothetical protein
MLAISQKISHKRQSRKNVGFFTASNQNEGLTRVTDFPYTSIIWLTQGKFAIVDNDDYEWLSQWEWCFHINYARRTDKSSGRQKTVSMHSIISKTPLGKFTDHINGNGTDNRKYNLRICSSAENARNLPVNRRSTSGYKGVTWNKRTKNWRARIVFDGKEIYLGTYQNVIDAAEAYNRAALRLHGEFARINQIKGKSTQSA